MQRITDGEMLKLVKKDQVIIKCKQGRIFFSYNGKYRWVQQITREINGGWEYMEVNLMDSVK